MEPPMSRESPVSGSSGYVRCGARGKSRIIRFSDARRLAYVADRAKRRLLVSACVARRDCLQQTALGPRGEHAICAPTTPA
jgi:hypothetical protein